MREWLCAFVHQQVRTDAAARALIPGDDSAACALLRTSNCIHDALELAAHQLQRK